MILSGTGTAQESVQMRENLTTEIAALIIQSSKATSRKERARLDECIRVLENACKNCKLEEVWGFTLVDLLHSCPAV